MNLLRAARMLTLTLPLLVSPACYSPCYPYDKTTMYRFLLVLLELQVAAPIVCELK